MAIDPDHLLEQAEWLMEVERGAPRQVDLRRAVSAAYYALFHLFCAAGADLFVGNTYGKTERYQRVYRSLNHGSSKRSCEKYTRDESNPESLRKIATSYAGLQISRHSADYDPHKNFSVSDASQAINAARSSIRSWRSVKKENKAEFLTKLFFSSNR